MTDSSRRAFLTTSIAAGLCVGCSPPSGETASASEIFVCPPCECSMDDVDFDAPGICPDCGMTLKPKLERQLGLEPSMLPSRAGIFEMRGGVGHESSHIRVHYYKPDAFTPDTDILLIIPGAGRNGDSYRNTWLKTARGKNVFIAALEYPEEDYDIAAYHMGGVVENLSFENVRRDQTNPRAEVIHMRDEDIKLDVNANSDTWLFNDFDRVFDQIVSATASNQTSYDIFGHSAGGQILHRLALFHPKSRARRIIAANAGYYTLPDLSITPPLGLAGTGVTEANLIEAFETNLTVLLGENDNSDAAGGSLIHTPLIDRQGLDRLSRGKSFFRMAQELALSKNSRFNWSLKTVPNVGHDFRAMSTTAAEILYS